MNATAEQIEKATENTNKVIAMGCTLTFDQIFAMELKKVQKSGWKAMTTKDIKKAASRERVETMEAPEGDLATILRENAKNNLPSSMR